MPPKTKNKRREGVAGNTVDVAYFYEKAVADRKGSLLEKGGKGGS